MTTGTRKAFSHWARAGTSGRPAPAAAMSTVTRGIGNDRQPSSRARSRAVSSPGPGEVVDARRPGAARGGDERGGDVVVVHELEARPRDRGAR